MPLLESSGRRLYYETTGTGKPLVLQHGFAADGFTWVSVKDLLAKHFTVIIPDNRLSGRSQAEDAAVAAADLAKDTADLLDSLGIEKAVIAGHSMGGYAAQEFALAYPQRTEKLILESTAGCTSARNKTLFANLYRLLLRNGYDDIFWHAVYPWILKPSVYENPDTIGFIMDIARKYPYLPAPQQFLRQVEVLAAHDAEKRLAGISAKTLVIAGEQDILVPAGEGRALAEAIPGARFVLAPEAAHTVHLDLPDMFADTLTTFINGE